MFFLLFFLHFFKHLSFVQSCAKYFGFLTRGSESCEQWHLSFSPLQSINNQTTGWSFCHMRRKCVMKSAQYIYAAQKVNHYMAWWKFQLTRYLSQENCIITSTNTSFWVTAIATPRADSRFPNWSGQHLGYIFLTHHPPLASWCEP